MRTHSNPSNKIIALMMAAFMVVGSVIYVQFAPAASSANQQNGTLSTQTENFPNSTDPLLNDSFKISAENAFKNPNFEENDNLTDRFSKTAFATYISLQNLGIGDEESENTIVSSLASQAGALGYTEKYTTVDLKTFDPKDKAAVKEYGNEFIKTEVSFFKAVGNDKDKYSKDLAALADVYETIGSQLSKIEVPKDAVTNHLKAINNYQSTAEAMRDMLIYENDPLKGIMAVKTMKEAQEKQVTVYTDIAKYFATNGILFNDDEPGVVWKTPKQQ